MGEHKPATAYTAKANAEVLERLPFEDTRDFDDAARGLIAPLPDEGRIYDDQGRQVWDPVVFDEVTSVGDAPDTVNPSLWRVLNLLRHRGLFEVVPGIYQVRGADAANVTIVEGPEGLVIMDAGMGYDNARASMDLYREHRGHDKPVVAVVYSHSHIDHYGGVRGIIDEADVKAGKVKVVAPEHFTFEAASENVFAGNAMGRRASYQYGSLLERNVTGNLGSGLGLNTPTSPITLILPTHEITETGQTMELGGLLFEFMMAPGSEAPAEMFTRIPQLRAMSVAEDANHTLHNVYTLRGAKLRDALAWSDYLDAAIREWVDEVDVLFGPHHWPTWGTAEIRDHLAKQRDIYKYLNDEVLRLANHGYNMDEATEMIELPESLDKHWANRGYYGSVSHNAKAVWAYYLGYFDGNPAHLHALPQEPAARKKVEYMGGGDAILERARKDFEAGEYRWVADVVDTLVTAEPDNQAARELLADTYERLGYQEENGTWRNYYLSGTQELRHGVLELPAPAFGTPDTIRAVPTELYLQYLAVRLNGPQAHDKYVTFNLVLPDIDESYGLVLENAVLHVAPVVESPDATLTLDRTTMDGIILGERNFQDVIADGAATISGDQGKFHEFLDMLDDFDFWWNVAWPRS